MLFDGIDPQKNEGWFPLVENNKETEGKLFFRGNCLQRSIMMKKTKQKMLISRDKFSLDEVETPSNVI